MPKPKKYREKWIDPLLQGLTFWVGYKHQLYPHHHINEGAIQSEAALLIQANRYDGDKLYCEKSYSEIVSSNHNSGKNDVRADIYIEKKDGSKIIIEIKRYPNKAGISKDFKKMLDLRNSVNKVDIKCYLLLVGEGKLPLNFVDKNKGTAKRGKIIHEDEFILKVRRVCKSTSSFKENKFMKKANYACLIELISHD